MAHHAEPMDVDCIDSEFDNKENTFHHGNVPCTEKGYEELDVSELNMKLRFSTTPASSPMSKSYTACPENRYTETESALSYSNLNCNLTRSLNSSMTNNDSVIKSLKNLPLQSLHSEHSSEVKSNPGVLRQLDTTLTDDANVTVTITGANEVDENLSSPSSSSSALHTPEATTPTKDIKDGGSPIMRGLKSVLNMFRPSQSPVPPADEDISTEKRETSITDTSISESVRHHVVASTPITAHRAKDGHSSKRSSPYKDSIVFNDDLEKELNWQNDTTITSSTTDKIPISKMLLQNKPGSDLTDCNAENNLNTTAEYMDVSNNDTVIEDKTITAPESDSEFVDCETTFSKNESYVLDVQSVQQKLAVNDTFSKNESYILDVQAVREVLSPSLPDLPDEIAPANIPVQNSQIHTQPDIRNVSFADLEFKDEGDMTLPTDYSDYSKCTSEILSELDKVEANLSSEAEINDNVIQIKEVTEQAGSNEVTSTISLHENNTETMEAAETEDKNKDNIKSQVIITPTQEVKTDSMPQDVPVNEIITQANNTTVELNLKENAEGQATCIEDNLRGECSRIDTSHQDLTNINDLNLTEVLVTNNMENVSEDTICAVSSNKIETSTVINVTETEPSEMFVENLNNPKSIDISSVIPNNVPSENVINSEYKDMSSVNLCISQGDTSLKSLDVLLSTEITSLDTSNAIESSVAAKPSDLPLPDDDDDLDKEIDPIECPAMTIETTPNTTEVHMAVTPPDSYKIKIVEEDIVNAESIISPETTQMTQLLAPFENKESSIDVPTSCENNLEKNPINVTTNIDQACNMSIDEDCSMVLETPILTAELTSAIVTNEDKNITDAITHLDNKFDTKDISEVIVNNNETMNMVCSQEVVSKLDVAVSDISQEPVQNCVENEAMDISMHETLNKTHGLPDLVDQTFDVTEENTDCVKPTLEQDRPSDAPITENKINLNVYETEPCIPDNKSQSESQNISSENSFNNSARLENAILTGCVDENHKNLKETEIKEVHLQEVSQKDDNVTQSDELPPKIFTNLPMSDPIDNKSINEAIGILLHSAAYSIKLEDNILTGSSVDQDFNEINKSKNVENLEVATEVTSCQKDKKLSENEELPPKIFTNSPITEPIEDKTITVDEEVVVSATNSPYVSLMSSIEAVPEKTEEAFEEIENPFATQTNMASSPPIVSKGYNFDFDDIDDPFATKTKIRLSPPLDTPNKTIGTIDEVKQFKVSSVPDNKKADMSRRKSQPAERKKPTPLKKKINASFDLKDTPTKPVTKIVDNVSRIAEDSNNKTVGVIDSDVPQRELSITESSTNEIIEPLNDNKQNNLQNETNNATVVLDHLTQTCEESKAMNESTFETKTPSSSEQSAYYSAGASSTESMKTSKNVFNLPEIDDMNFNPFATKSKICSSPPPVDTEMDNPFATKSKMRVSPPPSVNVENPCVTKSKIPLSPPPNMNIDDAFTTKTEIRISPDKVISQLELNRTVTFDDSKLKGIDSDDKMETELMEKDTSANTTDTTSSKTSENQNITTREVNTEDEDTIEGPFLDVGDEIEKMADFDVNNDMMNFDEIKEAPPGNDENLDGEIFIDAEAFEFLLNQNKSNVVADSGKESLFLKFDPLFAKRISSSGVLASLSAQKKQSTPTKPARLSLRNEASPIAGPSTLNASYEGDTNISQESVEDANITVTKPMMVVPPALNPAVTPRNKSITPTRSNRRSITFTSPAIAVIDRLLSMSSNNSLLGQDTTFTQPNNEQSEAESALTQLRELLAEKEISVYNLRCESNELKDRLSAMESQVKNLEQEGQARLKKVNELNDRLTEKTKQNRSMAAVVEEYERTIASLIADIEQDKKQRAEEKRQLIHERDEQTAHLTSMEVSFSDLHSKYEKSKQVILTCKANEDIYKKSIKDFEEQVTKMQANYEMLKQHATAKLNHANQELEKINRAHEAEVVKLKAMIKRNQVLATSLQETLAQKTKANDELTAICDELINKVG